MTTLPTEVDSGSTVPALTSIQVPATANQLSTLRGLTGTIAHNRGFTVDDVADLELAVDETVSMLIGHAAPSSNIVCTFYAPGGSLRIVMSATLTSESAVSKSSFGWFVLDALTDSAELDVICEQSDDATNAATVTVTLLKNLLQHVE